MSSGAMVAGVAGLRAHQKMLDVAGNNLANVNTTAFKSSRVTFADTLSNTIRQASPPTASVGGTNPQQIGTGVALASIDRDVGQGSLLNTGQPLDLAIEGAGYFVLNDGETDLFTRVGAFTVDSDYYLVDPNTGYRVQRIGNVGEAEQFQTIGDPDIRIPYDKPVQANETTTITYAGNLSANLESITTTQMSSGMQYTKGGVAVSDLTGTRLDELDQATGLDTTDVITVYGYKADSTELGGGAGVDINLWNAGNYLTVQDFLDEISTVFGTSTATMVNGEIILTDDAAGFSETEMFLEYTGAGSFTLPKHFIYNAVGGLATRETNIKIYDSLGSPHTVSATFVKTDALATWDLVITSMTGDVILNDRRVSEITFGTDGAYAGLDGTDTTTFLVTYSHDPAARTIQLDLGTVGGFDGLTQFGGDQTASAAGQDGYSYGSLLNLSISSEGVLEGAFTNGVRRQIASACLAVFQNPAALEAIGNNYFAASANSGDPKKTSGLSAGAGAVRGGSLEKSNVEVAEEFVNMIQAQNGFQANARTIRVANEMLSELTNLIR